MTIYFTSNSSVHVSVLFVQVHFFFYPPMEMENKKDKVKLIPFKGLITLQRTCS